MAKNVTHLPQPNASPQRAGDEDAFNEDWDDENANAPNLRFSVQELLAHLTGAPETLTGQDLFAFSDLSLHDAEYLREEWQAIPVERRRSVVRNLVDLAQERLDLHLGRFLRIVLHDTDAAVRQLALEGLWEETSTDLVGPLLDLLQHDESSAVRAAAAAGLGNYVLAGELDELDATHAMRVEQVLLAVLRNADEPLVIQCRALESIAYSGETGIRQLIEDAYYSPQEELRVSSLIAMGRSADVHWRGYARAELQSPAPAMRAEAAIACGELETKSALRELIELLADDELPVRLAAIYALGHIGGRDARTALRTVSEEGEPAEVEAAETALEEMTFFADSNGVDLFDEEADLEDVLDDEPWHSRGDDDDLGEYEQ
jgi:HEAT repeat protein